MKPWYTMRLFSGTAHVLKSENETACGKYVPPYQQPRYVVRPRASQVCRRCGAGEGEPRGASDATRNSSA
jgi:hypothetical protein